MTSAHFMILYSKSTYLVLFSSKPMKCKPCKTVHDFTFFFKFTYSLKLSIHVYIYGYVADTVNPEIIPCLITRL